MNAAVTASRSRQAPKHMPASLLVGLLLLDVAGFLPGVSVMTSVVAAAVLLAIDARGLLTLDGLIRWRRLRPRTWIVVACLAVVFFQLLVAFYLMQRLFGMATRGFRPWAVERPRPVGAPEVAEEEEVSPDVRADALQRQLNALLSETGNRLPPDLFEKVLAVAAAVGEVLPAYRASNLAAHDRFVLERTVEDYLPSAVRSYLKLSPAYRCLPVPEAHGKTPSRLLSDQLDLLLETIRRIAHIAYRRDLEELLVHGRFLDFKFGKSSLTVNS